MTRSKFTPVLGVLLLVLAGLVVQTFFARLIPEPTPAQAFPVRVDPLPAPKLVLHKEQEALVAHLARKYRKPEELVERIVMAAYREAKNVGLSPTLLLAIMMQESSLDPKARSGYGAVGLMQVVPRFHKEKLSDPTREDLLHKPEENIRVGAAILAEYRRLKGGDLRAALAKYSGGARSYADKVARYRAELEAVRKSAA